MMNTPPRLSNSDSISLSPDGWRAIETTAQKLGINLSELWLKIASKDILLVEAEKIEDLLDTISGLEGLLSAKEEGTVPWEQVNL